MSGSHLTHALGLAQAGFPVFPLGVRSKHPLISADDGGKGLHDATTDEAQIRQWWGSDPRANIGIRTGVNVDVIDIDGPQGLDSLMAARGHDGEPLTGPMVRTGHGWHVFVSPTGSGNRAGMFPSVDYRGVGGYVVAPPSVHPDGHRYVWVNPDLRDLREVPDWFRKHLVRHIPEQTVRAPILGSGDAYARAALRGELERIAAAPEGQRNHTLNRASFVLGQLVGAGKLNENVTWNALMDAGQAIGLSERECRATVHSGLEAGIKQPRAVSLEQGR